MLGDPWYIYLFCFVLFYSISTIHCPQRGWGSCPFFLFLFLVLVHLGNTRKMHKTTDNYCEVLTNSRQDCSWILTDLFTMDFMYISKGFWRLHTWTAYLICYPVTGGLKMPRCQWDCYIYLYYLFVYLPPYRHKCSKQYKMTAEQPFTYLLKLHHSSFSHDRNKTIERNLITV